MRLVLPVMCGRPGISSVRRYDSRSMGIQMYLYRPSAGYCESLLLMSIVSLIFFWMHKVFLKLRDEKYFIVSRII